jgi:hypothetical protein
MVLKEVFKKILSIFNQEPAREDNKEYHLSFCNGNKAIEIKNITNNIYNINVDPNKLDTNQKNKLVEIYPEIRENNGLILKKEDLEKFEEFKLQAQEIPVLKFYKGKIKDEDYQALRISAFIQKKYNAGEEIRSDLDGLHKKYGKRGYSINNLYGTGYFDNFLKLYYLNLTMAAKECEFQNFFDQFVTEQPMTYFVNNDMSEERVIEDANYKIERCKKYGIKRLGIYGIGKLNKDKIKNFANTLEGREDVFIISIIEIGATISLILGIGSQ